MRLAQAQIPALFAALESAGITVPAQARAQFYAFLRLGLAPEDWKSYLGPLVIKDLAQRQVFEQTFDAWMTEAQAELDGLLAPPPVILPPKPGPDAPGPRRRYGVALALVAAGIIYAFMGPKEGPQLPPTTPDAGPVATTTATTTPPITSTTGPALATTQKFWVPKLTVVPPPARWPWALGLLGVTGLAAGAISYYARRRRLLAEPPPYQISEGAATALGLVGQTGGAALLEPEEELGWVAAVQHITADFYTRQLALKSTIDATCRQAGLPKLVFQMGRALQKVWIWVDQTPSARGLENLAQVLTQSLTKNGIEAQRLWFNGLPDQLITQTGAQDAPENYSEDREKAQLWVLTRPEPWHQALDDPYLRPGVHALCRGLAAFKSCALVVAQDPGPLAERLAPWGLKVISVEHLVRGGAPAAPRLDQLQAWAAVLALAPRPVSAAEAQKLRSALQLVVSPRALEHLPGNQHGAAGYGAPAETRQKLLRWLIHSQSHQTPVTLLPRALVAWRQLIPEPSEVPARDRWAWQRAFWALLGPLDPSGAPVVAELSPQEALDTLDTYAAQGYAAEIKEATQYLTPADHPIPGRVKLPWAAAQLAPEYRLKMWRLGLWEGPPPELRWAGGTYAALALCAGLAISGSGALFFYSPLCPPPSWSEGPVDAFFWVDVGDAINSASGTCPEYQVRVSTRQDDVVQIVPGGGHVKISWEEQERPCKERITSDSELMRCGSRAPSRRGDQPKLSVLVWVYQTQEEYDWVQRAAIRLLDTGSVDRVYLGPALGVPRWFDGIPGVDVMFLAPRGPDSKGFFGQMLAVQFQSIGLAKSLVYGRGTDWFDFWSLFGAVGEDFFEFKLNLEDGEMMRIERGDFVVGCNPSAEANCPNREQIRERLPDFLIDRTEVTVGAYEICVRAGACQVPGRHFKECNWDKVDHQSHPINCVSWDQADQYCRWRGKRLPTEAEWEKAARGREMRTYPWGNGAIREEFTHVCDGKCAESGRTAPVGSYASDTSPYGVLDMAGNVSEWVGGWAEINKLRAFKGGNWSDKFIDVSLWGHRTALPGVSVAVVGFRCALSTEQQ